MAHAAPDLTSCLGSGDNMSCKQKDRKLPSSHADAGSSGSVLEVQNRGGPSPGGRPLAPQNFVWRRAASNRPTSSSSTAESVPADEGDMAVDVPVLRECFDPWRRDRSDEDDGQAGRCEGCDKISRARAAAAAIAAVSTAVAVSPPPTSPRVLAHAVSFWSSLPPIFRQPHAAARSVPH
ncbi:hypothetical protein B0J18DRAFT_274452 [Chaetomium sp. MPI-SDFR-AT-0129]|nr:hypothetical protein B0J18DRAFT_274452 [Chaetomium sp. MPI-SDFR-AT-0129]